MEQRARRAIIRLGRNAERGGLFWGASIIERKRASEWGI